MDSHQNTPLDARRTAGPNARALVLGGGGSAGNAWEIGVLAGLFDAGLDVTHADLIVGTSAGATVAAQTTGASPAALYADILAAVPPPRGGTPAAARPAGSPRGPGGPADHMERTGRIIAAAHSAADMRRRMGAAAIELDAASDGSWSTTWRATTASRLPHDRWPQQLVRITAVDAGTGEGAVFDRHSGVDLVDAVAASTSSGLPYRLGGRLYIDGGYRRNENADLAAGYVRVLVLSPFGGRTRHPLEWGMQLAAQVEELRAGGSAVQTVVPDRAALDAFGGNMMNLAARKPAARAGFEHGRALGKELAAFWD
ncbi:patatin [Sinomonas cellulolyticus]|uniref:Patatin-like phospholipase family protein n=1 Tax=Sinomonas cellulolyticus TaxID=2801916 RepID=A0ABS1K365_9MICC|nr:MULTISPECIES: patatin-like phospholipase family protein [Sinomonas]MBL0706096.1 patatin-like phospholipase family protein [Sinomonas cellulolyticus]GHG43456.1 patatin [Sinomonas sp. KCTC 49339]